MEEGDCYAVAEKYFPMATNIDLAFVIAIPNSCLIYANLAMCKFEKAFEYCVKAIEIYLINATHEHQAWITVEKRGESSIELTS